MNVHLDWDPAHTALLTIDLQNDFLHPDGAYGRAGQTNEVIQSLPNRIAPIVKALKAKGGVYISAQFTLVPRPDGEPLISPHLKSLRPFLRKGDFEPGHFGHKLVDTLQPADYVIEKVTYSAFHQTRLEYVLRSVGIQTLVIGGIVTNGGVASTVRDAHGRGIPTILLSDGSAAFRQDIHDASLLSLGTIGQQMTCNEVQSWLEL